MHSNHLLLEEPIRMASILEPSKAVRFSIPNFDFFFGRGSVSGFDLIWYVSLFCRAFFLQ